MLCAVTIAVKFGVNLILLVSLSLITGKNCFVACPFVVWSHWFCDLAMLCSLSCCTTSLLGILLKDMLSFLVDVCVCVCMYICMHAFIYAYIYIYVCMYICICMCVCMYVTLLNICPTSQCLILEDHNLVIT